MQISIKRGDLQKGLKWVQGIVERKSTSPALVNVLLTTSGKNTLELSATDMTISLVGRVPASVGKQGGVAVNAKKIFDVVNVLPDGEVTVEKLENNWALIKCGRVEYKLVGAQTSEFPTIQKPAGAKLIKVKKSVLEKMISKTVYAVSVEEVRRSLSGVYMESTADGGVRMVATDGHRLAMVEAELSGDQKTDISGVIIPRKGFNEIKKVLSDVEEEDVELGIQQNQVILNTKDVTLTSKLIEGAFPNYEQVIPKDNDKVVQVGRSVLVDSLRRMSILSAEHSNIVMLKIAKGKLDISGTDPTAGEGREEIDVDFQGATLSVGINARYILEALAAMESDLVNINMADELSALLLKPEGAEKYSCVVMPVRL
jgi:DNA polymerase-3 subunit beta